MNETDSAHNDEAQASDVLSSSATSITEEEYIYTPLEDNHVRLLEILPGNDKDPIQCRFHIVSRDELDALPYGALSYTWGTTKPDKRIFIDGKFVLITSNLEDALIAIRKGISRFKQTQRYLWVDSICINQKNAKERANQVRLMTKIYLQASLLVVWLGL
ncbi:hypothetical protein OIDMADRAFT_136646, partial [Oidiodendron maius Zn]